MSTCMNVATLHPPIERGVYTDYVVLRIFPVLYTSMPLGLGGCLVLVSGQAAELERTGKGYALKMSPTENPTERSLDSLRQGIRTLVIQDKMLSTLRGS